MKIHSDIEQRTDKWFALRMGRITGTRIKEMAAGRSSTVETLCLKIAAEKMTGVTSEKPIVVSDAIRHGIETEDEARVAYEVEKLVNVQEVGFVERDDLFGISPDGLISSNGGIEIKCPMPHTHLKYLLKKGTAWTEYRWQIQGSLWVTKYDYWDFISYCPSYPGNKRLLIERVKPIVEDQAKIAAKAEQCRDRIKEIMRESNE